DVKKVSESDKDRDVNQTRPEHIGDGKLACTWREGRQSLDDAVSHPAKRLVHSIERTCRPGLCQPLNGFGHKKENGGNQRRRCDGGEIEDGAPVVHREETLRKKPANYSSNWIADGHQRDAQVPAFCI